MTGNGWKRREMSENVISKMAGWDGIGWKGLEVAGNCWKLLEWLEQAGMAGNGWE